MTERDRPAADAHEQLPPREPASPTDEYWEELIDQQSQLDQELLKQAREYVQEKYGATYWDEVRREAEAFWDRRYDPNSTEDW